MTDVPAERITACNDRSENPDGSYVLYWMIANRRLRSNFSLQHAVESARRLGVPVLIFEALRCGYQWASVRLHRFVIEGMKDNADAAGKAGVSYYAYVEPEAGKGHGLLEALADQACLVVTDDFPCFFLPRMVESAAKKLSVRLDAVDSNGLYPMRSSEQVFTRAFSFRNYLQKKLAPFLSQFPDSDPLDSEDLRKGDCIPQSILEKWPQADLRELTGEGGLTSLPIDQSVGPAVVSGGANKAQERLAAFVDDLLPRYGEDRNHPDDDVSSGLSPYLHFGHIASHEVFTRIAEHEDWTPDSLGSQKDTRGSREGWWGMSEAAEAFLDELITWRELGYNMCALDPEYDRYESLPDFALRTLSEHSGDERPHIYTTEEFAESKTHDEIWNAAQTELRTTGRMHNYLRMLWGKKILEWTHSPQDALEVMIELNNRFAVDGRNPNSYSGIFWVLGRYDRAWGPERPIYGKIRYMTSDSTRKKLRMKEYLRRFSTEREGTLF